MQLSSNRLKETSLILSIIAIPIVIFFYFLNWKTSTIYGDDLSIYINFANLNSLSEKINFSLPSGKFRPIHGLSVTFLIEIFQKNLIAYYFFNVAIQALVAFSFALVVNLFLKSPLRSLFVSLTLGLSRFAFFNITQLLNGGALEGLAMVFFLLSLFFILRTLVAADFNSSRKQKEIILSIVFANLCLYTHERYIVFMPFIGLLILFFPSLKDISQKQRLKLIVIALVSIILNIFIKKYIYSMPFLVGTGGTNISFSFSTAFQFFIEAILSILQINSGPHYLIGISFSALPFYSKLLSLLPCFIFLLIFLLYLSDLRKICDFKQNKNHLMFYVSKKQTVNYNNFLVFLSLSVLLVFLLASAVITIRLEPRWLQAPLSVFVLMVAVVSSSLKLSKKLFENVLLLAFVFSFLGADYNYLSRGASNIYIESTENTASIFKQAVDDRIIQPDTDNLYIWKKQSDTATEPNLRWCLIDGTFFDYYQNKSKKLIFIDSTSAKLKINKSSDQVIFFNNQQVIELTDLYLQDFIPQSLGGIDLPDKTIKPLNKPEILKWGPEETKVGVVANQQPDGKMGIWISVVLTEGIGEVQVLFEGQPLPTAVSAKGVSAGVAPAQFSTVGDKKIEIQVVDSKEIIPVGTFKVLP